MSDVYVPTLSHPKTPSARQAKVAKTLGGTAAEQVSVTQRFYKAATVSAVKASPNTPNAADIYIGFDSTDQPIKLGAGLSLSIQSGVDGWPNDLSDVWIKGTSGDGVVVNFQEGLTNE